MRHLLLLLLLSSTLMLAQNDSKGKVEYTMILNLNGQKINNATLLFDKNESYFLWNYKGEDEKTTSKVDKDDDNNLKVDMKIQKAVYVDSIGILNYKNLKQKQLISRAFLGKKLYYVKEEISTIKWEIEIDTKVIADFVCQKATTRFRGRNYTAWFTNRIPISNGPWKFQGLPGLILEITDDKKEVAFFFKSLTIPSSLTAPELDFSKLTYVTLDQFKKDRDEYINSFFNKKDVDKKLKSKLPRNTSVNIKVDRKVKFIEIDTKN